MRMLGCSLALAAALAVPAYAQSARSIHTDLFLSAIRHGGNDLFLSAIRQQVDQRLAFASVGDELSTPRGWFLPDPGPVGGAAVDPPRVRPAPDPPRVPPVPDVPPGGSGGGGGAGGGGVGGGDPVLTPVPEPAAMLLTAAGLFAIGGIALWRKRSA